MCWSDVGMNNNITGFSSSFKLCKFIDDIVRTDLHMFMFNIQNRKICPSIFVHS